MAKWSNVRDAFLRSLRIKSGQGAKKRYIYSEHLQFLLKIAQKDETESNFSQAGTEDDSIEVEEFTEAQVSTASAPSTSRSTSKKHVPKSKRQLDDIEREILTELKKGKQSDEPCSGNASHSHHPRSDQEMLLLSFLPYIRDMRETELMDFQMEVLTTIKNIKNRRVTNQRTFQQHHVNPPPLQQQYVTKSLPSPAMSHSDSYQSSLQSFEYQSPPPSNQMVQQQQEPPSQRLTDYTGTNKYQQLFEETME